MARLKKGAFTGLIGNAVLSTWKGQQVAKVYQSEVKNPQTVAQMHNRKSFATISSFCSLHKQMIKIGFQSHDRTFYPMNEARSVNAPKFTITGTWPDITVHYEKIKLASGTLPLPTEVTAHVDNNNLIINWKGNESLLISNSGDFLMVALHYPEAEGNESKAVHYKCVAWRMHRTVTIPLENRQSKHFHAWLFFMADSLNTEYDKKNVSNSLYLGEFE
jgi:hypothetical protein